MRIIIYTCYSTAVMEEIEQTGFKLSRAIQHNDMTRTNSAHQMVSNVFRGNKWPFGPEPSAVAADNPAVTSIYQQQAVAAIVEKLEQNRSQDTAIRQQQIGEFTRVSHTAGASPHFRLQQQQSEFLAASGGAMMPIAEGIDKRSYVEVGAAQFSQLLPSVSQEVCYIRR